MTPRELQDIRDRQQGNRTDVAVLLEALDERNNLLAQCRSLWLRMSKTGEWDPVAIALLIVAIDDLDGEP